LTPKLNQQKQSSSYEEKFAIVVARDNTNAGELTDCEDTLCSSIAESPRDRESGRLGAKSLDSFHRNAQHVKRPCESKDHFKKLLREWFERPIVHQQGGKMETVIIRRSPHDRD
jgi:hypothetical protein